MSTSEKYRHIIQVTGHTKKNLLELVETRRVCSLVEKLPEKVTADEAADRLGMSYSNSSTVYSIGNSRVGAPCNSFWGSLQFIFVDKITKTAIVLY